MGTSLRLLFKLTSVSLALGTFWGVGRRLPVFQSLRKQVAIETISLAETNRAGDLSQSPFLG